MSADYFAGDNLSEFPQQHLNQEHFLLSELFGPLGPTALPAVDIQDFK